MKHIVIIVAYFEPLYGGGERQLRYLIDSMTKIDFKISLLTLGVSGSKNFENLKGVDVYRYGSNFQGSKQINGYKSILKKIQSREFCFDIAYIIPTPRFAIEEQANILNYLSSIEKPFVIRVPSIGSVEHFCRYSDFIKNSYLRANKYLALNEEIAFELKSIKISADRILKIRNGVNIDLFCPPTLNEKRNLRMQKGYDLNTKIVLSATRLDIKKNLHKLIELWANLENANLIQKEKHILVIAGSSTSHSNTISSGELKRLIDAFNANTIHFYNTYGRTDIYNIYKISDIYCSFSEIEGMSNSCLEALSTGLPVIVPDNAAYQFLSGKSFSFTYNNYDEAKKQIVNVLNMKSVIFSKISKSARKFIIERHNLKECLNPLINLFDTL